MLGKWSQHWTKAMQGSWVMLTLLLSPDLSFLDLATAPALWQPWHLSHCKLTKGKWVHSLHAHQKIVYWWDLGWEWKRLFISGKKEGRKSDSSYINICFVCCGGASWRAPCVLCAGGITCLLSDTANECFCLTALLCANTFSHFSSSLSPQILFLITVLNNCAI